jgi:hypothetical protein
MIARLVASGRGGLMDEQETAAVVEGDVSASVAETARKPRPRGAPKWEIEARDRLKVAIRRYSKPLADLVARDANEGDTRLLVTDFLCDGLGFDKYADLTPSTRSRVSSPISGCASTASWWLSLRLNGWPPSCRLAISARSRCTPSTRAWSGSS